MLLPLPPLLPLRLLLLLPMRLRKLLCPLCPPPVVPLLLLLLLRLRLRPPLLLVLTTVAGFLLSVLSSLPLPLPPAPAPAAAALPRRVCMACRE
jgi:hypothetical protein